MDELSIPPSMLEPPPAPPTKRNCYCGSPDYIPHPLGAGLYCGRQIRKAERVHAEGAPFQGLPLFKEPTIRDYLFAWGLDPTNAKGLTIDIWVGHLWRGDRKPITDDPWPFTPENCGYARWHCGWWTSDNTQLFCPGCGLDGT